MASERKKQPPMLQAPIVNFPLSSPISEEISSPSCSSAEEERTRPFDFLVKATRQKVEKSQREGRRSQGDTSARLSMGGITKKKKGAKPVGLNLVTSFAQEPVPTPVQDGMGGPLVDLNDLKQLSKAREKERTALKIQKKFPVPVEIVSKSRKDKKDKTRTQWNDSLKKRTSRAFQRLDDESPHAGPFLNPNSEDLLTEKTDHGLSPSDRNVMIGLMVPHNETSERSREFDSSGDLITPLTPSIIVTPAREDAPWSSESPSPELLRPRPASSVYSQPTPRLPESDIPPVPAIPREHALPKRKNTPSEFLNSHFAAMTRKHRSLSAGAVLDMDSPDSERPRTITDDQDRHLLDRLSVNTEASRPASQGWWNVLLSPLLGRSNTISSKKSPTTPGFQSSPLSPPAMPSPQDTNKHWWEKEKEISCFSPDTPETVATNMWRDGEKSMIEQSLSRDIQQGDDVSAPNRQNAISMMMGENRIQGAAAEYYQACAHELFSKSPFFECYNHVCSITPPHVIAALISAQENATEDRGLGLAGAEAHTTDSQVKDAEVPTVAHGLLIDVDVPEEEATKEIGCATCAHRRNSVSSVDSWPSTTVETVDGDHDHDHDHEKDLPPIPQTETKDISDAPAQPLAAELLAREIAQHLRDISQSSVAPPASEAERAPVPDAYMPPEPIAPAPTPAPVAMPEPAPAPPYVPPAPVSREVEPAPAPNFPPEPAPAPAPYVPPPAPYYPPEPAPPPPAQIAMPEPAPIPPPAPYYPPEPVPAAVAMPEPAPYVAPTPEPPMAPAAVDPPPEFQSQYPQYQHQPQVINNYYYAAPPPEVPQAPVTEDQAVPPEYSKNPFYQQQQQEEAAKRAEIVAAEWPRAPPVPQSYVNDPPQEKDIVKVPLEFQQSPYEARRTPPVHQGYSQVTAKEAEIFKAPTELQDKSHEWPSAPPPQPYQHDPPQEADIVKVPIEFQQASYENGSPFAAHAYSQNPPQEADIVKVPIEYQQTNESAPRGGSSPQNERSLDHLSPQNRGSHAGAEPISPGFQRAAGGPGSIPMSEVTAPAPTYPQHTRDAPLPLRYDQYPVAGAAVMDPTGEISPGEAQRRRLEREDAAGKKMGGLWRRRGCFSKKGCFGRPGREGRLRRRWYFGIAAIFLTIIIVAIVLATTLTRKSPNSTHVQSQWLNLTNYPPIQTGIMTIAGTVNKVADSGCTTIEQTWSCALPKGSQQTQNSPYDADEPTFRVEILYRNGTSSSNSTAKRENWTASPSAPSIEDQTFIGNTTDGNSKPFAGEETPFYMSIISPAHLSSTNVYRRSTTTSTNSSSDLTIPPPDENSDGTAAAASLYPLATLQPVRLYNRGKDTEHYGFYTYFDKSIFQQSRASINTSSVDYDPEDSNGGSTEAEAKARCTWSQSRFLVQIWTKSSKIGYSLLSGSATATATATASSTSTSSTATSSSSSATDYTRPGSFGYPVTLTVDRHGGNGLKKNSYCWGIESDSHYNLTDWKYMSEDRGYGGTIVNPMMRYQNNITGYGGIDGGTGGCKCEWVNWASSN